jgi:hypothetical protein
MYEYVQSRWVSCYVCYHLGEYCQTVGLKAAVPTIFANTLYVCGEDYRRRYGTAKHFCNMEKKEMLKKTFSVFFFSEMPHSLP